MKMSHSEIVARLKAKVSDESTLLLEILDLLELVRERRIFTDYGYSSLFEFCTQELRYSESAAMRRINALRIQSKSSDIKNLIHQKIQQGSLNLSQLGVVAKLERSEKLTIDQLQNAIVASTNTSARETEKIVREKLQLAPLLMNTKIVVELDSAQLAQAEALASKYSHALPQKNLSGLFLYLLDQELKRETSKEAKSCARREAEKNCKINVHAKVDINADPKADIIPDFRSSIGADTRNSAKSEAGVKRDSLPTSVVKTSRVFSRDVQVLAAKRSGGRCEFVSQVTQRRCDSQWFLQFDHIHPWSLGGRSTLENCRVACGAHNRAEWKRVSQKTG